MSKKMNTIKKGQQKVEIVLWYWDRRGAWREFEECNTEEAAYQLILVEKLDRWYIEKRTREIIDISKTKGV